MFDAVWTRVVAGRYRSAPGRARGFSRFAVAGESYPAVVRSARGEVIGRVYLDVAPEDLARLDAFEGDEYRRARARIELLDPGFDPLGEAPPPQQGRGTTTAELYLFLAAARLAPHPWDAQRFGREQIDRFIATYAGGAWPSR